MKKFGISEFQQKATNYYNLDIVISVGYRVKSKQGTLFRIWTTNRLKEYIIKGFVLNDKRFKAGKSMNYFDELQERIREIRLSERLKIFTQPVLTMTQQMKRQLSFFKLCKISFYGQ